MENPYAPSHPEIRDAVRQLCLKFDGTYWRALDRERGYPTEFVKALTEAGWLAILIPEEYGGSGLGISAAAAVLEEVQRAGCNGAACHAQMYIMGTLLRHGSVEQKERYLPKIASGELRLQAFGVTEPSSGTDTLALRTTAVKKDNSTYVVNGQKVWTSRAEHSDLMLLLARTTPRSPETHRGTVGVPGRHARGAGQGPHRPADPHHDEPQQHRSVLRQHGSAGREPDRRGGAGLPLHPGRHERRARADRLGMHPDYFVDGSESDLASAPHNYCRVHTKTARWCWPTAATLTSPAGPTRCSSTTATRTCRRP